MSGSSETDHATDCRNQLLLHLLIYIAVQRQRYQRVWLVWSPDTPTGWDVI